MSSGEAYAAQRAEVAEAVYQILAETFEKPQESIEGRTRLSRLASDSMALIDASVRLEERFDVALPDLDGLGDRQIERVDDLVDIVMEQLGSGA